ncbi:hypothetical protein BASA81_007314 [Batrachochytrium salamandrivorans]|nr:hypothetical protein BASA81_007314 [Batrachochytrium salamandrivorans]
MEQQLVLADLQNCATAREVERIVLENPTRQLNENNTSTALFLLGKFRSRNVDAKSRLVQFAQKMTFQPREMANLCMGFGLVDITPTLPEFVTEQLTTPLLSQCTPRQIAAMLESMARLGDGNPKVFETISNEVSRRSPIQMDEFAAEQFASLMNSCSKLSMVDSIKLRDKVCNHLVTTGSFPILPKYAASVFASLTVLEDYTRSELCEKLALELDKWDEFDSASMAHFLLYAVKSHAKLTPTFLSQLEINMNKQILSPPSTTTTTVTTTRGFEAKYYFDIKQALSELGHTTLPNAQAEYYVHLFMSLANTKPISNWELCDKFVDEAANHAHWYNFSPTHVLAVLHSLELCNGYKPKPVLFQSIAPSAMSRLGEFKTHQLSMLLRAMARTEFRDQGLFQAISHELIMRNNTTYDATDIYLMLESMVKLGFHQPKLCDKFIEVISTNKSLRRAFKTHQLEVILDCLGTLGCNRDSMVSELLKHELTKQHKSLSWSKPV